MAPSLLQPHRSTASCTAPSCFCPSTTFSCFLQICFLGLHFSYLQFSSKFAGSTPANKSARTPSVLTTIGSWSYSARFSFRFTSPAKRSYWSYRGHCFVKSSSLSLLAVSDHPRWAVTVGCWPLLALIRTTQPRACAKRVLDEGIDNWKWDSGSWM